jgi:hypothetical protein
VAGNLSTKLPWELAQTKWAGTLNPVIANVLLQGRLLEDLSVSTGTNAIAHGLGRNLVGYFVVRNNAAVTFYDAQASQQRPDLFLSLVASGAATISLYVF